MRILPLPNLSFYDSIIRPILFSVPPELAHEFALKTLNNRVVRACFEQPQRFDELGTLKRFGLNFPSPVGLAAGFDKNGTAAHALAHLGFGFIEVGTVTNQPQPGNPKPRLFRLPRDHALINRLGFNNNGAQKLAEQIRSRPPNCILGVNIGKSRSVAVESAIPDYLESFAAIYDIADYVAINVSSPNTPNLRELQRADRLADLLKALQERNGELAASKRTTAKPLLLKIAPDLAEADVEAIIDIATRTRMAGLIATNTTVSREGLRTRVADVQSLGDGGLSGAPLREPSNRIISFIYRTTQGRLPIVGVGGVFNAEDAWLKICAGASLVQLYTGFIYEGPAVARRINEGLISIMKREGFRSLDEAVGCGASEWMQDKN